MPNPEVKVSNKIWIPCVGS